MERQVNVVLSDDDIIYFHALKDYFNKESIMQKPEKGHHGVTNKSNKNLHFNSNEYKIISFLNNIGMPSNRKGYRFIIDALQMVMDKPDLMDSITKRMYPEIAKKNKTTASNVERGIRHIIEIAWFRNEKIKNLFGNSMKRPTNGEFIASAFQKIRMEDYMAFSC